LLLQCNFINSYLSPAPTVFGRPLGQAYAI